LVGIPSPAVALGGTLGQEGWRGGRRREEGRGRRGRREEHTSTGDGRVIGVRVSDPIRTLVGIPGPAVALDSTLRQEEGAARGLCAAFLDTKILGHV
jgi:hypothetical protein